MFAIIYQQHDYIKKNLLSSHCLIRVSHLVEEKKLHRNVSANNTYSEVTEPPTGLESPALNQQFTALLNKPTWTLGVVQHIRLDWALSKLMG